MPLAASPHTVALLPKLVGTALCALVAPSAAASETVYRCPGNVYQQVPCSGGRALQIDPATNAMQAPSAADRALAAQWDARTHGGPWVATLPMPPRMEPTPSQPSVPQGFGHGFPYPYWPAAPAYGPPPRVGHGGGVPPAPVPAYPSRAAPAGR